MPGFRWACTPVVVSPIRKPDLCRYEFFRLKLVESGELYGNVVTANFLDMAPGKRTHAAVLAKQVMADFLIELIVAQVVLSG
jgi:hypothetical protein